MRTSRKQHFDMSMRKISMSIFYHANFRPGKEACSSLLKIFNNEGKTVGALFVETQSKHQRYSKASRLSIYTKRLSNRIAS